MGLIGNTLSIYGLPCRFAGATYRFRSGEGAGGSRMQYAGGVRSTAAVPLGALHPRAYTLPQKSGGIAALTGANITFTGSSTLVPARPMLANASIVFTGAITLGSIASMLANGTLVLTASGTGSGAASMSATGNITTTASILIGSIVSAMASGNITLNGSGFLTALASMHATDENEGGLTSENIANSLLDQELIETGITMRQALRVVLSALAGRVSGAETTTITFRNTSDTKDRIIATVDTNGNRSSIVLDTSEG